MSNFILKVFLSHSALENQSWIKLTPKFKDFQGLEFLISNSRTLKVRANPGHTKGGAESDSSQNPPNGKLACRLRWARGGGKCL